MAKEDVVCIYNGILLSQKNEIMLFVAIQMNLETVTLRRVSQTESDLERELSYDTAYRQNPNDTNELT